MFHEEDDHEPAPAFGLPATGGPEEGALPVAGPEPGPFDASPTSRRLDPAYVSASRLAGAITTAVFTLTGTTGVAVLWFVSDMSSVWKGTIAGGAALLLLGIGLLAYLWPPLEFARTSWSIDEEGIEIRRGVVFRHVIFVPRSRIQHTDVSQGPLQRRFGLATLVVNTAGTHEHEINLDGIARATALEARDSLLEDAEVRSGDGA
jgi:membrane protein YdbS with pleckstrin-like domain